MTDRPSSPTEELSEVQDPIAVSPEHVTMAPSESARRRMPRRRWLWLSLAVFLLLVLGLYLLWPKITGTDPASMAAKAAKAGPTPIPGNSGNFPQRGHRRVLFGAWRRYATRYGYG